MIKKVRAYLPKGSGPIARRWIQWFLTTVTITAVGAMLLPVLRRNPEGVHSYFAGAPAWQNVLALFVASTSTVWILFKLLSPKLSHLRPSVAIKLPPMWAAWAVAGFTLGVIDLTFGLGPSNFQAEVWEWVLYGGGSVLFVAGCQYFTRVPERPTVDPSQSNMTSVEELVGDWVTLEQWLRSEQPAEHDLIGTRRIAHRLAKYLTTNGGSVGLIGPFGSGKSSVLAWLKKEVEQVREPGQPKLLFAEQSCWGFEDSSLAVQQVLTQAMEVVGREFDCFSLRSLPESYRKMFSAGGDWVRTLADLVLGSTDPLEQFRQLSGVLESLNVRLVLIIEDLDRNSTSRFDRQEVQALLQRLRASSKRISFVLATGQTSARDIDFAKLCDHIEILPYFDVPKVSALIEALRNRCLTIFSDIATVSADENPWKWTSQLLARFDLMTLLEAAANLLRTPRSLKHALRRTYQAWQALHGEVDFDHLLAANILRYGAPEAFDFLLRHWDQLQDDPNSWVWHDRRNQVERLQKRLTAEWQGATQKIEWDVRDGMRILLYLLPQAGDYLNVRRESDPRSLQGIDKQRYWLRVVNEEIDPSHTCDKVVLRDIADWLAFPQVTSPLVTSMCAGKDYAEVWLHLAPHFFTGESDHILVFAGHILEHYRNAYRARIPQANGLVNSTQPVFHPEPAFLATLQYANSRVQPDDTIRDWLKQQLGLAMQLSLRQVNDLYYFWAGKYGVVRSEDRVYIRQVIRNLAKEHLRNGEDLLRVSHSEYRYGICHLVFPPDSKYDETSVLECLPHWQWLGPIMLEALRANPTGFALEVGHLISKKHTKIAVCEVDRSLLQGFFDESATEVMGLIASVVENHQGHERKFLEELIQSSRGGELRTQLHP